MGDNILALLVVLFFTPIVYTIASGYVAAIVMMWLSLIGAIYRPARVLAVDILKAGPIDWPIMLIRKAIR